MDIQRLGSNHLKFQIINISYLYPHHTMIVRNIPGYIMDILNVVFLHMFKN